jgi:hypothetical protein
MNTKELTSDLANTRARKNFLKSEPSLGFLANIQQMSKFSEN